MVKKQEQETAPIAQYHDTAKGLRRFLLLAAVVAAGYGLWRNPQIVSQIKATLPSFEAPRPEENPQQMQIQALQTQLQSLQNQLMLLANRPSASGDSEDLASLKEKIAAVEKTNLNVIDSKADVATVLGVVTRMDKAEQRLDKMAEISDEGALVLTATMLVKDSAERGETFEYEMEVLEQISADNAKLKEPLAVMRKSAATGIASAESLRRSFDVFYKKQLKEQKKNFEKTWKDRLNAKLGEIVQIKRVDAEHKKFEADADLQKACDAVEAGNFKAALAALDNPADEQLKNNPELKDWMSKAQARVDFYNAVSRLSASSLAMLKVNFLKKAK